MTQLRILVVDDNEPDRDLMAAACEDLPWVRSFRAASSVGEAFDLLSDEWADLVFCDMGMGTDGGLQFLESIKAHVEYRVIPVVMLTLSVRDSDRFHCYRSGASGYVVKPMDYAELVEMMDVMRAYWFELSRPVFRP